MKLNVITEASGVSLFQFTRKPPSHKISVIIYMVAICEDSDTK